MNIFHRLGDWFEGRRSAKNKDVAALVARVEALEKGGKHLTDLAALKVRTDRLELFVGLKRQAAQAAAATTPGVA